MTSLLKTDFEPKFNPACKAQHKSNIQRRINQKIIEEQIKAIFNMKDNAFSDINSESIIDENVKEKEAKSKKAFEEEANSIREAEFQIKKIIDITFRECILTRVINQEESTNESCSKANPSSFNFPLEEQSHDSIYSPFNEKKLIGFSPKVLIKAFYKTLDCYIRMSKERVFDENYTYQLLYDRLYICTSSPSSEEKKHKMEELISSNWKSINGLFEVAESLLEAFLEGSDYFNKVFNKEIEKVNFEYKINLNFKLLSMKFFIHHFIIRNKILYVRYITKLYIN